MATLSLPPQLEEISNVIGLSAALKLAEAKGGQRITIPGNIKESHWLVDLLGLEKARSLSQYFTNGSRISIEMPRGPTSSAARRNVEIYKRLDAGENSNQIAAATQVTRRWVLELKARRRDGLEAPALPDLFDQ